MTTDLSRPDYEAEAARTSIETMTDREIESAAYGLIYGDFTMSHYTREHREKMDLARRRLYGLRAEKKAAQPVQAAPRIEYVSCPNCGRQTTRGMLMNASLGTACPDCYDDLSD